MSLVKTLLLAIALLLSGCGTIYVADEKLFAGLEVDNGLQGKGAVAVYWITYDTVEELHEKCNSVSHTACAHPGGTKASCLENHKDPTKCKHMLEGIEYCVIMTLKQTSYAVLGHEARHCFHGHFHD